MYNNLQSCVNVVLDFVSPENVAECIKLINELRLLPDNHTAKTNKLEVNFCNHLLHVFIILPVFGDGIDWLHGLFISFFFFSFHSR